MIHVNTLKISAYLTETTDAIWKMPNAHKSWYHGKLSVKLIKDSVGQVSIIQELDHLDELFVDATEDSFVYLMKKI